MKKKTGPVATTLTTVEAAKEAVEKNEVYVLGFFADVESDNAKAFLSAASEIDDVAFGVSSEAAVATEYKVTGDAVVLFKKVCLFISLYLSHVIYIYIYFHFLKNIYSLETIIYMIYDSVL